MSVERHLHYITLVLFTQAVITLFFGFLALAMLSDTLESNQPKQVCGDRHE